VEDAPADMRDDPARRLRVPGDAHQVVVGVEGQGERVERPGGLRRRRQQRCRCGPGPQDARDAREGCHAGQKATPAGVGCFSHVVDFRSCHVGSYGGATAPNIAHRGRQALRLTADPGPVPNPPMRSVTALAAGIRHAGNRMLDIVLPPRCLKCGATVDATGALCAACWPAVAFLSPPPCAACGLPFEFDLGPDALCGACAGERPVFERARAAFRYDDASKDLILRFKHADRTDSAPAFARWMARAGAGLLTDAD